MITDNLDYNDLIISRIDTTTSIAKRELTPIFEKFLDNDDDILIYKKQIVAKKIILPDLTKGVITYFRNDRYFGDDLLDKSLVNIFSRYLRLTMFLYESDIQDIVYKSYKLFGRNKGFKYASVYSSQILNLFHNFDEAIENKMMYGNEIIDLTIPIEDEQEIYKCYDGLRITKERQPIFL